MIRNLVYVIFFAGIAVSVVYKARIIEGKEKREVVSITEEWKKHGKPVDIAPVIKGDAHCLEKISGIIGRDDIIYCQVSEDVVSKLRKGQVFTAVLKGKTISGHVTAVSGKMEMLSGLYAVKLKITTENGFKQKSIVVAKVRVNTLRNVFKIPQTAVIRDNSHTYCWVVRDSMAEKRDIVPGMDCESDIQILSGLKLKEQVCVNGLAELSDNDEVRIRNTRGAGQ